MKLWDIRNTQSSLSSSQRMSSAITSYWICMHDLELESQQMQMIVAYTNHQWKFEKNIILIQLTQEPIKVYCQSENNLNGHWFDNMTKGITNINLYWLKKCYNNKVSLGLCN